jgi:DNA primase catalytic subunit
VLELDSLEVAFELANFSAVCIHRVLDAVRLLVDLLDDDLGIAKSQ